MTITFKKGNILNATEDIIIQQVNSKGVMSGGLALQIRNKYPDIYFQYTRFCKIYSFDTIKKLGLVNYYNCPNDSYIIANVFGQDGFGRDKCYTDYVALENGLMDVFSWSNDRLDMNLSIAIPKNLGCGLAGGDWSVVFGIIEKLDDEFKNIVIYDFYG